MAKITTAAGSLAAAGSSVLGSLLGGALGAEKKPYDSVISVNGNDVASSKVKNHKVSTSYNMSKDEKNLLDYTNQHLLSGLKNINVFSDNVRQNIQKQLDAYKLSGIKTINDTYTPMFNELKSDVVSRFGNLDNSTFIDNLNSIEKNRAEAISSLTQEILAKQNELYEQEMTNRYNYLNSLASTNEQLYSNILKFLDIANTSARR
ncbi:hypothetical protein J6S88_04330 [bacterium]|nr:hypothetical protein [bacterium]